MNRTAFLAGIGAAGSSLAVPMTRLMPAEETLLADAEWAFAAEGGAMTPFVRSAITPSIVRAALRQPGTTWFVLRWPSGWWTSWSVAGPHAFRFESLAQDLRETSATYATAASPFPVP